MEELSDMEVTLGGMGLWDVSELHTDLRDDSPPETWKNRGHAQKPRPLTVEEEDDVINHTNPDFFREEKAAQSSPGTSGYSSFPADAGETVKGR